MKELNLYMSDVEELSAVRGMTQLEELDIYACSRIKDLSPISGLKRLRKLNLYMSKVEDFSAVEGLTALEEIWLQFTQIKNLNFLRHAEKLKEVKGNWCKQLSDISALRGKRHLEILDLDETLVRH